MEEMKESTCRSGQSRGFFLDSDDSVKQKQKICHLWYFAPNRWSKFRSYSSSLLSPKLSLPSGLGPSMCVSLPHSWPKFLTIWAKRCIQMFLLDILQHPRRYYSRVSRLFVSYAAAQRFEATLSSDKTSRVTVITSASQIITHTIVQNV